jgi:membrane associated rhomboid family serine protease
MYSTISLPKGLKVLIIATTVAWVAELLPGLGAVFMNLGALVPFQAISHLEIWRFVSYLFLHDPHSPFHLLFNMLALWMFGVELEELWGTKRFVTFYFLSGVLSGLFSVLWWHSFVIGASGAILALLTVYAMYFPDRTILLFFIFPVPVRLAVVIIGAISIWGAWTGGGGVAYLTHLGGIAVGFFYYKYYSGVVEWWRRRTTSVPENKPTILEFRRKDDGQSGRDARPGVSVNGKAADAASPDESEIDRILEKISRSGMDSLTEKERKILLDASGRKKN